jgi:hypothetical protein
VLLVPDVRWVALDITKEMEGKGLSKSVLVVVCALAFGGVAQGSVTQPESFVLKAYEPRTWVASVPAGTVTSTVTVSHRGWSEVYDAQYEEDKGPACRWKAVLGFGHTGVLVIHHDDCRARRPAVTVTWVPRPGPRARSLRVSAQADYILRREVPEVETPAAPSDFAFLCSVVPAGEVPPDAAPIEGMTRMIRRAQAYLAGRKDSR